MNFTRPPIFTTENTEITAVSVFSVSSVVNRPLCHTEQGQIVLIRMRHTLIIGGGYAGTLAAIRMARRGVPVTVVDQG